MTTSNKAGRPRSARARRAILEATWALLQTRSLRDVSIERIAKEAGVGKATIYRHWSSKAAVVMDMFRERFPPQRSVAEGQSASAALERQLAAVVEAMRGSVGRILAQILADGQSDPETLEAFRETLLSERRAAVGRVIRSGMESGEFDPELDVECVIDLIYGPIYYRLLVKHQALDDRFARSIIELALRTCRPRGDP